MTDLHKYEELAMTLRREIHQIPEIAAEEHKTSEFIMNTLKSFGINNMKKLYNIGTANPDMPNTHNPLHNPHFNIDENAL